MRGARFGSNMPTGRSTNLAIPRLGAEIHDAIPVALAEPHLVVDLGDQRHYYLLGIGKGKLEIPERFAPSLEAIRREASQA